SEFSLKQEYPTAELIFPNRKGSIAVEIDGEKKGIAAWSPNRLAIGNLRAGVHFLKLKVIGDGIGLYRTGFNNAGCSEVEIISAKPF
ncbi:MAG: hypothetical protein KAG97_02500, partial [Victivallales bacterium]|nr:hypothetical protein [Victivallales bacterium]